MLKHFIGNPQYPMMPPGQPMGNMGRGMPMNPSHAQNNQNKLENMIQGDQYVPGGLEDQAINALTSADYKYTDVNDLLPDDVEVNEADVVDPGKCSLL